MFPETKLRLPEYFGQAVRRQIGELYASVGIANFALAMVAVFEPIFLYAVLHLSIPQILFFNGIVYVVYIFTIPFGGKIAARFGYAHGILFSIPFQILYWVFLYAGQDNHALLWIAPVFYGLEKALYWPAFGASVSRFARRDQMGREYSVLYAIINIVGIVGPLLGGLLSQKFGIRMTFIVASALYTCSFIPLFLQREEFIPKAYYYRDTWELFKTYPMKFLGYLGYGEEMLLLNVWPIFIYVIVIGYEKVGALVTVATLVASILAIYVGKVSDQYNKQVLLKVGSFFYFLFWIFRLIAVTPYTVFAADALSRTGKDLVSIPLTALTYERAESTHIIRYVVFYEQSLSVGKMLAVLLGAIAFQLTTVVLGFSLAAGFMVLFVLAGLFSLLYMCL